MASAAASKAGPRLADVAGRARRRGERFELLLLDGISKFDLSFKSANKFAEHFDAAGSGLKPCTRKKGSIAALEALRHPKSMVATFRLAPEYGLPRPAWRREQLADGATASGRRPHFLRRCL